MKAGDIFAEVGGVDATTMDLDMLVQNHIRGEEGTEVVITVYRPDSGEYIDMPIERRKVSVDTVEAKINGDIGYISVSEFDQVSAGQFMAAIDTLQERGMKKLIVDMRNNPGGEVNTVITMTDYLLDQDQVIFSMAGKKGKERVFKSEDHHKVDLPTVVLVNGNSASAAEIFTGAAADGPHFVACADIPDKSVDCAFPEMLAADSIGDIDIILSVPCQDQRQIHRFMQLPGKEARHDRAVNMKQSGIFLPDPVCGIRRERVAGNVSYQFPGVDARISDNRKLID